MEPHGVARTTEFPETNIDTNTKLTRLNKDGHLLRLYNTTTVTEWFTQYKVQDP